MDKKGNCQTVVPEEKNENSFLKFDKNSSIIENFIKNFWNQLKEPTHFRIIRMTFNDYKQSKQAINDLSERKQSYIYIFKIHLYKLNFWRYGNH